MTTTTEKGWEERLNTLLFNNITASEDLNKMRPMKIGLISDLVEFIREIEKEVYEEGKSRVE